MTKWRELPNRVTNAALYKTSTYISSHVWVMRQVYACWCNPLLPCLPFLHFIFKLKNTIEIFDLSKKKSLHSFSLLLPLIWASWMKCAQWINRGLSNLCCLTFEYIAYWKCFAFRKHLLSYQDWWFFMWDIKKKLKRNGYHLPYAIHNCSIEMSKIVLNNKRINC